MFEYKEVEKRDGTRLIFCNIEELLLDFYGAHNLDEIKQHETDTGEYIIHCPFCKEEGHTKHKLYIKSDLSVGHCFVCHRAYINVKDEVKFEVNLPDFGYTFNREPFKLVKLEDPYWTLDKFQYEFDDFDEKGYQYLLGRHKYMKDLYKILGFKFLDGNVVMPFYYHGEVIYYQIRFTGNSSIRYFFPPISKKPVYMIEHGCPKKLIICEGVFDAISLLIQAPTYTPIAVLGSSINNYQMEFIREFVPDKILIYMDETKLSYSILKKLQTVVDYCPIDIIRSNGEDPEEHLKKLIKYNRPLKWIS